MQVHKFEAMRRQVLSELLEKMRQREDVLNSQKRSPDLSGDGGLGAAWDKAELREGQCVEIEVVQKGPLG